MKEIEADGERIQSVYGIFSAPAVVGGTGQMNTEFEVFARHSYVSHLVFFSLGQGLSKEAFPFPMGQYTKQGDAMFSLA